MTDLIVIGGGVTGCAVARDAALRGLRVTLLERDELGGGTSGRFHGMLQSGARYVTTDPAYAAQCMRERRIFEDTADHARADTGGLFVQLPDDPREFGEQFVAACRTADIPCRPLDSDEVAEREPLLAPTVRGYEVPDAVFRPWELVAALAEDAAAHGAVVLTKQPVVRITSDEHGCFVDSVRPDGSTEQLFARSVVIAAGPWSGGLAAGAGQTAALELAKGSMLIISRRIVTSVVNRCRPPGSFDIMVPFGEATIFGTTSRDVEDPGEVLVAPDEDAELLASAEVMIPDLQGVLEQVQSASYAGVRPLAALAPGTDGAVSRRHVVIADADSSVITVVGGSFTTHRAMAEDAVDEVCARLRINAPCKTVDASLPAARGLFAWSAHAALQPALLSDGARR